MPKLQGKRLLVLTGCLGDRDIVRYARSEGAFVVATDYLPNGEAKRLANVSAGVSTVDVDGLCVLAEKHGIDGIVTGASLTSTMSVSLVASSLNLPVPHSAGTIAAIDQKNSLNNFCHKHGVSAPRQYSAVDVTTIDLPVIVKPADASNSVGISRVTHLSTLGAAVDLAQQHSPTHSVIIEDDLGNGKEFIATIVASRGRYKLAAFCENVKFKQHNGLAGDAVFNFFPSPRASDGLMDLQRSLTSLLQDAGLENGTCSLQLMEHAGELKVYEGGCRLGGTQSYIFSKHEQGTSAMELLVHASLPGEQEAVDEIFNRLDWKWCRFYAQRNVTVRPGRISTVHAPDEGDASTLNVSRILPKSGLAVAVGDKAGPNILRGHFVAETISDLANALDAFSDSVVVKDDSGVDMRTEREAALPSAMSALSSLTPGAQKPDGRLR